MSSAEPAETFRVLDESTGGRFRVEVIPGGAFFEGHFPGHPVLPAVAQIALLERLFRRIRPGRSAFVGLEGLRCLGTVAPGDQLDVTLVLDASRPELRFEIDGPSGPVSRGQLRWEAPGTA